MNEEQPNMTGDERSHTPDLAKLGKHYTVNVIGPILVLNKDFLSIQLK